VRKLSAVPLWLILRGAVAGHTRDDGCHDVELSTGETLCARAVIVASGVEWRKLEVPGVEELLGRGYEDVGLDEYLKYGRVKRRYEGHTRYRFVEGEPRDVGLVTEIPHEWDQLIACAAMNGGEGRSKSGARERCVTPSPGWQGSSSYDAENDDGKMAFPREKGIHKRGGVRMRLGSGRFDSCQGGIRVHLDDRPILSECPGNSRIDTSEGRGRRGENQNRRPFGLAVGERSVGTHISQ